MHRLLALSVVLALTASSAVGFAADEKVKSGLQPKEHAGFFLVKDVTGPNKDESLCYR